MNECDAGRPHRCLIWTRSSSLALSQREFKVKLYQEIGNSQQYAVDLARVQMVGGGRQKSTHQLGIQTTMQRHGAACQARPWHLTHQNGPGIHDNWSRRGATVCTSLSSVRCAARHVQLPILACFCRSYFCRQPDFEAFRLSGGRVLVTHDAVSAFSFNLHSLRPACSECGSW